MRYALGMTDSSSPCTHARYGSTDFTRRDVVDNKTWCGWHTLARLSSPRLAFNEDSELVRRRKMANILDAMELAPPDDGHDSRACNRPEHSGRSVSPCCMRYLTAVHEARSMTTPLARLPALSVQTRGSIHRLMNDGRERYRYTERGAARWWLCGTQASGMERR